MADPGSEVSPATREAGPSGSGGLRPPWRAPASGLIRGCWQLSRDHGPGWSRDLAFAALDAAAAQPGRLWLDCADIYTGVEALLGEWMASRSLGRDRVVVHTKLVPGLAMLPRIDRGLVRGIVERSRDRLGVAALDLVQYYWWDRAVPGWIEAAEWLAELREEARPCATSASPTWAANRCAPCLTGASRSRPTRCSCRCWRPPASPGGARRVLPGARRRASVLRHAGGRPACPPGRRGLAVAHQIPPDRGRGGRLRRPGARARRARRPGRARGGPDGRALAAAYALSRPARRRDHRRPEPPRPRAPIPARCGSGARTSSIRRRGGDSPHRAGRGLRGRERPGRAPTAGASCGTTGSQLARHSPADARITPRFRSTFHALRQRIMGERLEAVRIRSPSLLKSFEPPVAHAHGKRVASLSRLGKRIVVGLEDRPVPGSST